MNYTGTERRKPNGDFERIAEEAACRAARKILGGFTNHDLETKDGRGELRADLRHLHATRMGVEEFRKVARSAAIKTAIGGGVAGIGYALYQAVVSNFKLP